MGTNANLVGIMKSTVLRLLGDFIIYISMQKVIHITKLSAFPSCLQVIGCTPQKAITLFFNYSN
jgi:hypothetical protein